ncbi:hypothetical protein M2419_004783 [Sphingobacterium sp. BIGb0116]|nr:hypothetical protein [Sphingobacterium sp. BIGb0116]
MLFGLNIIFISISVCFSHRTLFFCNEAFILYNKERVYKLKRCVSAYLEGHKRVVYRSEGTV